MKAFIITLLLSAVSITSSAQAKDEAFIKGVIEKETQSFFNSDAEGMISCWANVPYALSMGYFGKSAFYGTNSKLDLPDRYRMWLAGGKPNGSTFNHTDYVTHINNNTAFVYFDQTVTRADMSKNYSHEARNLEKINGEWKITFVCAVYYTPEIK